MIESSAFDCLNCELLMFNLFWGKHWQFLPIMILANSDKDYTVGCKRSTDIT